MALVTLSVLKSPSFKVCVMVDARPKRSSGSCVKINMVQKELGRLRPDWVSWLKSWIMEEISSVAWQGWMWVWVILWERKNCPCNPALSNRANNFSQRLSPQRGSSVGQPIQSWHGWWVNHWLCQPLGLACDGLTSSTCYGQLHLEDHCG